MFKVINDDCMNVMRNMKANSVEMVLTDIPYEFVSREDNGLRNLDKGKADIITFDLNTFLDDVYKVASNNIVIFCGKEQLSRVY